MVSSTVNAHHCFRSGIAEQTVHAARLETVGMLVPSSDNITYLDRFDCAFTLRRGDHRAGRKAFVHRPPVDLCGPLAQGIGTAHDGLYAADAALGVRIDEAAAELGAMLLHNTGDSAGGPDDPVLDTAARHVQRHLRDQFVPVGHHHFGHALVMAVQHNVGGHDRLAATGREHGKHVLCSSVPLVVHALLQRGLVGS